MPWVTRVFAPELFGAIPFLSTKWSKGTRFTAERNTFLVLWYPFESNIDLFHSNNHRRLNFEGIIFFSND